MGVGGGGGLQLVGVWSLALFRGLDKEAALLVAYITTWSFV